MVHGRTVATGSPRELRAQGKVSYRISCSTESGALFAAARSGQAPELPGADYSGTEGETVSYKSDCPGKAVPRLIEWVAERGDEIQGLSVEGPSLEERFMEVVRREA
jgi:ABC-type multidrug transport system ATPase subunit